MTLLLVGVVVLCAAILSGMLIGAAVGYAALVGHAGLGLTKTLDMVSIIAWDFSRSFTLSAVPLFVWMGEIASRTGLIRRVFDDFVILTRNTLPGGTLQPVILAGTLFAASSGSSTASAAALGTIIYPDLKRQGYPDGLSTGILAAAGGLAMLIPPSIMLVLYAAVAGASAGKLYLAAFVPGLMIAFVYAVYVAIKVPRPGKLRGSGYEAVIGTPSPSTLNRKDVLRAILHISSFVALMLTVMGPLYLGIATATEVAAVGCAGAMLLALAYNTLNKKVLLEAARSAILVTSMAYFILFGTMAFSTALALSGTTAKLPLLFESLGSAHVAFLLIVVFYMVLGMLFDSMSILLLTTPFILPVFTHFGFSVIWVGIFVTIMIEVGLLTPPVGTNLFVIQGVTKVPFLTVSRGSLPFVSILLLMVVALYLFPQILEWLPTMAGQ